MVDVIVVGAGVMGLSVALACRRRGLSVQVLESGPIPNQEAPSFGDTRVFRMAYFEAPEYVPWLKQARAGWINLESESGANLFVGSGVLSLGEPQVPLMAGGRQATLKSQIDVETLTAATIAERFPVFSNLGPEIGMFDHEGGFIFASAAVTAMIELALAMGVDFCSRERVLEVKTGSVVTATTSRAAGQIFVCAGLGTPHLLIDGRRARIRQTRQVLTYWRASHPALLSHPLLPVFAFQEPDGAFFYGFPLSRGSVGFKIAMHNEGETVAEARIPRASKSDFEPIRAFLTARMPGVKFRLQEANVCCYDCFGDGHLAVGPVAPGICVIASLSGHGFKFAPALGEVVVGDVLAGNDSVPPPFRAIRIF